MAMKKVVPAASPEAYVAALDGWRKSLVESLRKATHSAGKLDERIKWGHLVFFHNGPVLLIRAEDARVLFGFWRGKRLLDLEPRMKGSGKYEMLSLELREDTPIDPAIAEQLIRKAIEFNRTIGNPAARS